MFFFRYVFVVFICFYKVLVFLVRRVIWLMMDIFFICIGSMFSSWFISICCFMDGYKCFMIKRIWVSRFLKIYL